MKLNKNNKIPNKKKGAALIMVIFFLLFIGVVVITGTMGQMIRDYTKARDAIYSIKAYNMAEAGVEDVFYRVKNEMLYTSPEELALDGSTTTTIIIVSGDDTIIEAVSISNNRYRKVNAVVSNSIENVNILYGALAGQGGVLMTNNSYIQGSGGVEGDVYSNGPIIGDHGTKIWGQALAASGIVENTVARSMTCDAGVKVAEDTPFVDYAQSFVAPADVALTKIALYLKKIGAPLDAEVYLVADNGGVPDTTELAEGSLSSSLVGVNYAWVDIPFLMPATLVSGNTYWIVLDGKKSNSKYWDWCKDSSGAYANGKIQYGSDWTVGILNTEGGDLTFRLFFGEGQSLVDDMIISGTVKAHTIRDSVIGVDAYYADATTISGTTVGGTLYPGTPDSPIIPLPISTTTIATWKSDAAELETYSGDCYVATPSGSCSNLMGPLRIDGDLFIDADLKLLGVVHVTGNVYLTTNNVDVGCDISFGPLSCVMVVDGFADLKNGVSVLGSGDVDSYMIIVSDIKDCVGAPLAGCGPDNSGIHLNNGVTGGIYFTSDSMIHLSQTVDATSIVGYKLFLDQNASVTYEPSLIDLNFSSGADGGWRVNSWVEND